jgi:hypothetical protein
VCVEWGGGMVQGDHLLGLQIYTGSSGTGLWGEMAGEFSQGRCSLGLGSA